MTTITRRQAIVRAGAFSLASAFPVGRGAGAAPGDSGHRPPNVLFILADDLGYADLSCYGRRDYKTPNLDQLADEGVQLFNGYANSPVCSATRTALITGSYQYRFRWGLEEPLREDPDLGLDPQAETMPGIFRSLGYTTSLIGKWHLGPLPKFGPLKSGYDTFFGIYEGGTDYFTHQLMVDGRAIGGLFDGEEQVERKGYLTDLLTDRAIEEISFSARQSKPFFMSLHYTAPHWPWEGPQDANEASSVRNSVHRDGGSLAIYAEMVESLDANIGRLLGHLSELGLEGDTVVVFTSDNGGERFSDSWPFIGAKGELLEGGIRVPLIIRWPGRIAAGSKSYQVMASMDFLPTLVGAAGFEFTYRNHLDGLNLIEVLTEESPEIQRSIYWKFLFKDQHAVRNGPWKYLKIGEEEYLFNLDSDLRERANRKDVEKEVFNRLKKEFDEWNAGMLSYPEGVKSYDIGKIFADR